MPNIKISNIVLGNNQPKIAVSITAKDSADVNKQLDQILLVKPDLDLIEWRLDFLKQFPDRGLILKLLNKINNEIKPIPLIATFRTAAEGGQQPVSNKQYFQLLDLLAKQPQVNILDVELHHNQKRVSQIVHISHDYHTSIIMSYHNFHLTPNNNMILKTMNQMQLLQADIAKVAVMPRTKTDVMRFMQTSLQAQQQLSIPIVTMAMGNLGKITRICGAWTGSAITFGSLNTHISSAAGQIPVPNLRSILKLLDGDE